MKIAYIDMFSGVSGDMLLGAFVDCGLKISELKKELSKLKIEDFDLKVRKVKRGHIQATKVDVISKKEITGSRNMNQYIWSGIRVFLTPLLLRALYPEAPGRGKSSLPVLWAGRTPA